jgi:large subunit ribosomal protein L15
MRIADLKPPKGSNHRRTRLGRGHGSGKVKTSGRGQKGQKARTGAGIPAYFEGGQMRLARRLPILRGFDNPFRKEFGIVNVEQLEEWDGDTEINPETLVAQRFLRANEAELVKILGDGELTRKLTVRVHKCSASARQKIEAAGGHIELIPMKTTVQTKRGKKTPAPAEA